MRCSAFQVSVSLVITDADSPAELPRNWPSAGTKSPVDSPCRYSSGNTSVIFGVLRHHGGRIAEENLARSPVSGSTRRSLTRGARTSTAPALDWTAARHRHPHSTATGTPTVRLLLTSATSVPVEQLSDRKRRPAVLHARLQHRG